MGCHRVPCGSLVMGVWEERRTGENLGNYFILEMETGLQNLITIIMLINYCTWSSRTKVEWPISPLNSADRILPVLLRYEPNSRYLLNEEQSHP